MNNSQNMKNSQKIILMCISVFLSSFIYSFLIFPLNLVTGGVNGIAIILNHFYPINPSISIFFLQLICLFLSFLFLGKERTTKSAFFSLSYPLLIEIMGKLKDFIIIDTSDKLLIVIFAGLVSGITTSLMYKSGYSNGGLPILSQILFEKYKIAIAKSSMLINSTIVIVGSIYVGFNNLLYALLFLSIQSRVLNKSLTRNSKEKLVYLQTKNQKEIKQYLNKTVNNFITLSEDNFETKRIFFLISEQKYQNFRKNIKNIDKNIFLITIDISECSKRKFVD